MNDISLPCFRLDDQLACAPRSSDTSIQQEKAARLQAENTLAALEAKISSLESKIVRSEDKSGLPSFLTRVQASPAKSVAASEKR